MTLREKQSAFVRLVARLILHASEQGVEFTFGECYRTPEQAALNAKNGSGISNSLHTKRLAIDLMLFKDGVWLNKTEDHLPLGQWWEAQSTPDCKCVWGGRFSSRPDGNHYAVEHDGVR
jgi:hypothetical protein